MFYIHYSDDAYEKVKNNPTLFSNVMYLCEKTKDYFSSREFVVQWKKYDNYICVYVLVNMSVKDACNILNKFDEDVILKNEHLTDHIVFDCYFK